jgi:hypothetical protein
MGNYRDVRLRFTITEPDRLMDIVSYRLVSHLRCRPAFIIERGLPTLGQSHQPAVVRAVRPSPSRDLQQLVRTCDFISPLSRLIRLPATTLSGPKHETVEVLRLGPDMRSPPGWPGILGPSSAAATLRLGGTCGLITSFANAGRHGLTNNALRQKISLAATLWAFALLSQR